MMSIYRVGSADDGYSWYLILASSEQEAKEKWKRLFIKMSVTHAVDNEEASYYRDLAEKDPVVDDLGDEILLADDGYEIA
jgi:hypothetical protein